MRRWFCLDMDSDGGIMITVGVLNSPEQQHRFGWQWTDNPSNSTLDRKDNPLKTNLRKLTSWPLTIFLLLPARTHCEIAVQAWVQRYNGPGNGEDIAFAAVIDHSGNVIVTGRSAGSVDNSDFATIKYVCVPSPVISGLNLTNGTFKMRVDDVLQPGTLVIEASTNLASWSPVFTNTTPTNVLFYTDPDASNSPIRSYWAFQFP